MDWLQFFSSIVSSIAWPMTIVGAAIVFHTQLETLLKRVTSIELPGGKATFQNDLKKAEDVAYELPDTVAIAIPESAIKPDDPYLELANQYPEAAVLDSFKKVEALINNYREELPRSNIRWANTRLTINNLLDKKFINNNLYELYRDIAGLRNTAVHANGGSISPAQAIAYRDLCDRLIRELRPALEKAAQSFHS